MLHVLSAVAGTQQWNAEVEWKGMKTEEIRGSK